jgi:hypothetical protein
MRSLLILFLAALIGCGGGMEKELYSYKMKSKLLQLRVDELEAGRVLSKKVYDKAYSDFNVKMDALKEENERLLLGKSVCIESLKDASEKKRACDRELTAVKSGMRRLKAVCSEHITEVK